MEEAPLVQPHPTESVTPAVEPPSVPPLEAGLGSTTIEQFVFTGAAREFFGIWIVNLFLSIITLGIYSAWATVRKKRYMYGHTWLAGANFEYHGDPIAILKGRVIAFLAFAAYSATNYFMPKLAIGLLLVLFLAAPWFIARSMAFNALNSSYRNIRFRFLGSTREVLAVIWPVGVFLGISFFMPELDPAAAARPPTQFWVVVALQILAGVALYPYLIAGLRKLHVGRSAFGAAQFSIGATFGAFYKVYLKAIGLAMMLGMALGGFVSLFAVLRSGLAGPGSDDIGATASIVAALIAVGIVFGYLLLIAVLQGFTTARIANLVFNSSRQSDQLSFVSTQSARRLAILYLTNMIAILLTAGLAVPWAVIRVMRYRARCLALQSSVSLDTFVGAAGTNVDATGQEIGEFFNIDLSL